MRNQLIGLVLSVLILATGNMGAQAAGGVSKVIGGTAIANAIDDSRLVGSLTGALGGSARAEVTGETKTSSGLLLDMEHYFFTDEGGLLHTKDKAVLTSVPGKPKVFMIEITYSIVESSGVLEGYEGQFQSYGLFNLGAGKVVLRYKGEIFKK